MAKCIICGFKPRVEGLRYCTNCDSQIKSEKKRKGGDGFQHAEKFAVWHGYGVAFMLNGNGRLTPVAVPASAIPKLAKAKTLNLDTYLDGFSRAQVKKIKAAIKAVNGL